MGCVGVTGADDRGPTINRHRDKFANRFGPNDRVRIKRPDKVWRRLLFERAVDAEVYAAGKAKILKALDERDRLIESGAIQVFVYSSDGVIERSIINEDDSETLGECGGE